MCVSFFCCVYCVAVRADGLCGIAEAAAWRSIGSSRFVALPPRCICLHRCADEIVIYLRTLRMKLPELEGVLAALLVSAPDGLWQLNQTSAQIYRLQAEIEVRYASCYLHLCESMRACVFMF